MSKASRLAALEQLKKIKQRGEKNKYEPESTYEPVFDVVDEKEYENRVRKRQEESDWIVADALTDSKGYVEDGREVFDDEYCDYEDEQTGKSSKSNKSKNPNISSNNCNNEKSNIKRFFDNAPVKKASVTTTADDDELMQEAMSNYLPAEKVKPKSTAATISRRNVQNYGTKFSGTFEPKNLNDIAAENPVSNPFSLSKTNVTTTTNKRPPIQSPSKEFSPNKLPPIKQLKVDSSPAKKQLNFTNLKIQNNYPILEDQKCEIIDEFDEESKPKLTEADAKMEKNVKTFNKSLNLNLKLEEESSKEIYEPQKSNSQTMKFYLLDVYEDFSRNPGTIYLFGRKYDFEQKSYMSCALIVKDIERRLFILPRQKRMNLKTGELFGDTLEMTEIYEEIMQLTQKMNIPKMRCKFVKKKYNVVGSLNVDAPFETDYLEVRYGFNYPNIPSDTVGETFGAVFGSSSSALELFLIERNIKGPRWLEICDFGCGLSL
uniref:DNA polymerase alpha catalytic subunit N-terminal domain-containing protein n=1 Tax=Romanomermis culicivorax TaxID=13658 RepID=A0A915IW77_ROMCU